jgi:Carboxylesterase family
LEKSGERRGKYSRIIVLKMRSYIQEPCLQDLQSKGFIQGITIKDRDLQETICNYFGGIPYAKPPVGEYRWRRPRELEPCYSYGTRINPGMFDGKTATCPQHSGTEANMDENCLQLNIWVPAGKVPEGGWPIYFYIRMLKSLMQPDCYMAVSKRQHLFLERKRSVFRESVVVLLPKSIREA